MAYPMDTIAGVVRWCWINFQCRGVLLICNVEGQGPAALTVVAAWGCSEIFTLIYCFASFPLTLEGGPI